MDSKMLSTNEEYDQALRRLEVIFDAKKRTNEGDELEILSSLIEDYENQHFPLFSE